MQLQILEALQQSLKRNKQTDSSITQDLSLKLAATFSKLFRKMEI